MVWTFEIYERLIRNSVKKNEPSWVGKSGNGPINF